MCDFSKSTQHRLEKTGQFPKRVQLSEKRVAWIESEIIDFMQSRKRVE